jgi:hypothetical protein
VTRNKILEQQLAQKTRQEYTKELKIARQELEQYEKEEKSSTSVVLDSMLFLSLKILKILTIY